jgi:hypothetical protein
MYDGVDAQLHTDPYPWHYTEISGQLHSTSALLPGKEFLLTVG